MVLKTLTPFKKYIFDIGLDKPVKNKNCFINTFDYFGDYGFEGIIRYSNKFLDYKQLTDNEVRELLDDMIDNL